MRCSPFRGVSLTHRQVRESLSRNVRVGVVHSQEGTLYTTHTAIIWKVLPRRAVVCAIFVLVGSTACAETAHVDRQAFQFEEPHIEFSNQFSGARLSGCTRVSAGRYRLVVRPENMPVNNSAWYAFQVRSQQPRTIEVEMVYAAGVHRYVPKISRDGETWKSLDAKSFHSGRRQLTMTLEVGPQPLWIAAQELVTLARVDDWMGELAKRPFVEKRQIGSSVQGRPICKLDVGDTTKSNYIFIMARQHPPEVTGALGMMRFVETLCGDSETAARFRQHFKTVVVPLANPDGVEQGHWRYNASGVDLNRDWKDFAQPETQALRDELLEIDRQGQLYLFLDFHSTYQDMFYTHADSPRIQLTGFTQNWLTRLRRRFPDYEVCRQTCLETKNTSRSWVYRNFSIPAITYEFGDQAQRQHIRRIASGSAEEMMRLLLVAAISPPQKTPVVAEGPAGSDSPVRKATPVVAGQ